MRRNAVVGYSPVFDHAVDAECVLARIVRVRACVCTAPSHVLGEAEQETRRK